MKKLLLITLLFAFVLPVVGQEDSNMFRTKDDFKNQIDLDVEFFALSVNLTHKINKKLGINLNAGGLAAFKLIKEHHGGSDNFVDNAFEIYHAEVNLVHFINPSITIETGLKLAGFVLDDKIVDVYGTTISFFLGNTDVQYGFKSMIGRGNNNFLFSNSFLIIRMPIKKYKKDIILK